MSTNFSANQYEKSFSAQRLKNWEIPRKFKEHPTQRSGSSVLIANDRGHLLNGVPRSKTSPWGTFKGTWGDGMSHQQMETDMTLTNKQQDKIFPDFSKVLPDKSDSPLHSPSGNKETQLPEVQQDIHLANHDLQALPNSPVQNKIPSRLKGSPIPSPVAESPKPKSPITPTLEDKPLTPVKPSSPLAPLQDSARKSLSPIVN